MTNPMENEEAQEFYIGFAEALHSLIEQGVQIAQDDHGLSDQDAFSIMASRMLTLVTIGIVNGGSSKDAFLDMADALYNQVKLDLSEPEGTLQ